MKSTKEWISISDMMTGLMMIFLFIAVLYMNQQDSYMKQQKKVIKHIKYLTDQHTNYKKQVGNALKEEFHKDLKKWKAYIPPEDPLVIRFPPNIMFKGGSSQIKKTFKSILNNFCPRYFKVLKGVQAGISEIRIEGHTSMEWTWALSDKEAYLHNMKLSQDRARSVLQYCITLQNIPHYTSQWAIKKLTANGLSSSRPICVDKKIKACRPSNRRVEFRIQINESNIVNEVIKIVTHIFQLHSPKNQRRPAKTQSPQKKL